MNYKEIDRRVFVKGLVATAATVAMSDSALARLVEAVGSSDSGRNQGKQNHNVDIYQEEYVKKAKEMVEDAVNTAIEILENDRRMDPQELDHLSEVRLNNLLKISDLLETATQNKILTVYSEVFDCDDTDSASGFLNNDHLVQSVLSTLLEND